jgi:hypothetical protein
VDTFFRSAAYSTEVVFLSLILRSSGCLALLNLHLANWINRH